MRALFLDPGLVHDVGHHANYCRYIVDELRGRGIATRVLAYDRLPPPLQSELGAEPFFRAYPYRIEDSDPISGWLANFEMAWTTTLQDLARLTEVDADTMVFVSSAQPAQFMAAAVWQATLPPERQPMLAIEISESGLTTTRTADGLQDAVPDPRDEPRPILFRYVANRLSKLAARRRHIVAFDPAIAHSLTGLLGHPVATLPLPYPQIIEPRRRALPDGPVRLSILGHQRKAKGLQILPPLAAALLARRRDLALLIQTVGAVGEDIALAELKALAAADDRLVLEERPAGRLLWRRLLATADLILCPYEPAAYLASFSSVAAEAMANGVPIVVPADTTLQALLAACGAPGTSFARFNVASIVDATIAALDDYDGVAGRAHEAAIAWPRLRGPARMVDALLDLATRPA